MEEINKTKKEIYDKLKVVKNEDKKPLALYIHIPFCEKKCNYCSFVSFCDKFNKVDEYVDCLCKELLLRKLDNYYLKSIYIGGGTPSVLSAEKIEKILSVIKTIYEISDDAEITIEVNPNSITTEKALKYKEIGINRVSIGIQSLSDKKLKLLGRVHNRQIALNSLQILKDVGFDNVNCDLIISLSRQTQFEINKSIKLLKKFATHFSIYSLSIEDNTQFFDMYKRGELKLPSENKSAKLYNKTCKFLQKLGYKRYEVSNFAKRGYESKHNKTYWDLNEYLGIGIASHSFIGNMRYANTEDFDYYLTALSNGNLPFSCEKLSKQDLIEETIMLSLRVESGLNLEKLKANYNVDLLQTKKNEILLLKNLGLIYVENGFLKVTDRGFLLLNQIILKLV